MSKETQNKWEEDFELRFNNNWKLDINFWKDDLKNFISRIENEAYQRGKSETLEEVEEMIKENFNNQNGMTITYYDLLQTINKMKTNEKI